MNGMYRTYSAPFRGMLYTQRYALGWYIALLQSLFREVSSIRCYALG